MMNLSDTSLHNIYAMGYHFYLNGKYHEAKDCFFLLCSCKPVSFDYWMGLAASHQMLKQYDTAINCYEMAAVQDLANPYPSLHAADCFFALNDVKKGKKALDSVEKIIADQIEYKHLKNHIKLMRKMWLPKKKKDKKCLV